MSTKILVSLGLLLTIMINTAFAIPCVLLGSNPSFIVKFKDRRSNPFAKNLLSSQLLANLSKKTGIKFTSSKIMSQGAYILHFNPTHSKLLKHSAINNEGCFSRQTIDKIVEKLKKLPNVTLVEPNYLSVIEPNVEPPYPASTVSITPDQWDLKMIKVLDAWKITEGKPSVRAAVLDSGIVSNANLSPNLVSDAHGGVSFVENGETKVGATPSCTTECGNQYKHGTWVAGNIVSSGNGAYGELIDGVAKKGKVYPVNIFTKTIFDRFTIYTSDYVNAIEWLIGNYSVPKLGPPPKGIRVINLSIRFLNKGCGELEKKAFNDANNANVVVVVSAGNQNKETSSQAPAVCALHSPNVISVAALGPSGKRASYSNYGDYTTIAAPGGDRKDAIIPPATTNLIRTTGENAYDNVAGTSFASPEVAGVALLVATINPALNPAEIKGILTATAAPFKGYPSNPTFDCNIAPRTCGAGVVDAQAAVLLAQYAASASYKAYFDAPQLELTSFKNPLSICPAGEYVPSQQSISDSDDGISVVWRLNNTPSPGCKPISSYQPLSVINKNGVITANYGSAVSYTLNKNGHTCNLFMLPTTNEEIVGCA